MYEFRVYSKKNKAKNNVSNKKVFDKNNKIVRMAFRTDFELSQKIKEKCQEKNKSFSELNRILWGSYFNVEFNNAWKKEVENWK